MRKIALFTVGLALLGSTASASAQNAKSGAPRPGYIGIRYDEERFFPAPPTSRGQVLVKDVSKGSPAEKAGLKAGDEILRINGMSAANGKFEAVARTLTEGDTVKLRIKRDDKEREYTVIAAARPAGHAGRLGSETIIFSEDSVRVLMRGIMDSAMVRLDSIKFPHFRFERGDSGNINIRIERFNNGHGDTLIFGRPDTAEMRKLRERFETRAPGEIWRHFEGELGPGMIFKSIELGARSIAGAEFTTLDPAMKPYFGTDRGLLTLRVVPETPAARAGLMAGDVVVKANDRAVNTISDLRSLIVARQETIKLEVLRKGETKTLEIQTQRIRSED
jgi:membrane-associated protease RseP (regulator of RpoE activity)